MPKVSVVIPNYNHAPYLRQRIETVLQQSYQDFEVILLDDCSTDESRTIILEYANDPRVRIEFNEKNSGSTFKQWRKGVALARGKYIWIAESDDYADHQLLATLVSRLDADSAITLCNCRSWLVRSDPESIEYLDSRLDFIDPRRWTEDFCADGREECEKYLLQCCTVLNASSVVFRKQIYDRVEGVDDTMRMCGDWKLWAAMALEGKIAHVGGKPLNFYREHGTSVTNSSQRTGVYATEYLQVVRWVRDRVRPAETIVENAYLMAAGSWIPAVLSGRVPVGYRMALLRDALMIDPHALRRLIPQGLASVRLKIGLELRHLWQHFTGRAS